MPRRLTSEAVRCLGLFEEVTGVEAVDCVIDDTYDRVVFVVPVGDIADAIGPDGRTVRRVEDRLKRDVSLVELADRPEDLVANALRPAAVYDVEIREEEGRRIARAEVAAGDRGVAIGSDGRRIELAKMLASRHHDIDDIELTAG